MLRKGLGAAGLSLNVGVWKPSNCGLNLKSRFINIREQ